MKSQKSRFYRQFKRQGIGRQLFSGSRTSSQVEPVRGKEKSGRKIFRGGIINFLNKAILALKHPTTPLQHPMLKRSEATGKHLVLNMLNTGKHRVLKANLVRVYVSLLILILVLVSIWGIQYVRAQSITIQQNLDMGNTYKIINMANVSADSDAATIGYVKSAVAGTESGVGLWEHDTTNDYVYLTTIGASVGIGTTNPGAKLAVEGGNIYVDSGGTNYRGFYVRDAGGNEKARLVYLASGGQLLMRDSGDNISVMLRTDGGDNYIKDGNVGIGVTSPGSPLEVNGEIFAEGASDTLGAGGVALGDNFRYWVIRQDLTNRDFHIDRYYGGAYQTPPITIKRNTGNVGIGDTTPTEGTLTVAGTGYFTGVVTVATPTATTHAATKDYVDTAAGGGWVDDGTVVRLATSTDNVGIGVTVPYVRTHIAKSASGQGRLLVLQNTNAALNDTADLEFMITGGDTAMARISAKRINSPVDAGTDLIFSTYGTGNQINEVMRMDGSGNVGIGTTSPDETLHIEDDAIIKFEKSSALGNAGYIDFDGTSLQIGTQRNPNTGTFENTSRSQAGIVLRGADADSEIRFYTKDSNNAAATERMRIEKDGNVGIGTTSPASKLDVAGQIRSTVYSSPSSGAGMEMAYDSAASIGHLLAYDRTASAYKELRLRGNPISLTQGNVGIGTTDPGVELQIDGTSPRIRFRRTNTAIAAGGIEYVGNDDGLDWFAGTNVAFGNGYEIAESLTTDVRFYIERGGNVGIGATSPSEKLTIASAGKIAVYRSGNDRRGLFYTDGSGTWLESDSSGSDPLYLKSPGASGSLRFYTSSTEKVRIDSSGNVGIGATSPSTVLHARQTSAGGNNVVARFDYSSDNTYGRRAELRGYNTTWAGTANPYVEALTFYWAGNARGFFGYDVYGVEELQIASAYGDIVFNVEQLTQGADIYPSQPTERMRITKTGNVGIGNSSPGYTLDVSGTINASSNIYVNGTAVSTGAHTTDDQTCAEVSGCVEGAITDDTSVPKNHLANSGTLGFTWSDAEVSNTLTASSVPWSGVSSKPTSITRIQDLTGSYGSINIAGTTGAYAGINFVDEGIILMMDGAGATGVYTGTAWKWYFDTNGALTAGTVPWGRLTSVPDYEEETHASEHAGSGLGYSSDVLNVGVGSCVTIAADTVGVTGNCVNAATTDGFSLGETMGNCASTDVHKGDGGCEAESSLSVSYATSAGNATTATSLAADGTNCNAGYYPRGVDASGNAEVCTADANTDSQTLSYTASTDVITISGSGSTIDITEVDTNTQLSQTTVETYIANDISAYYVPYDNGVKLASTNIYYDSANSRVGIGVTSPASKLTVYGSSGNTSAQVKIHREQTTSSGGAGLLMHHNNAGGALPASGDRLGYLLFGTTDGTSNRQGGGVSAYADGAYSSTSYPTKLYFETAESGSTSRQKRLTIDNQGRVGIGDTTPDYALDVVGRIELSDFTGVGNDGLCWDAASPSTIGDCTSLRKYKKNIRDLSFGLETVMKMRPVEYDWIEEQGGKHDVGFIAEEVEEIAPVIADYGDGNLSGVKYRHYTAVLTKAIQEQQAQIKELRQELEALKQGKPKTAELSKSDFDSDSGMEKQAGFSVIGWFKDLIGRLLALVSQTMA